MFQLPTAICQKPTSPIIESFLIFSGKSASNPALLVPMSTGGATTMKTVMPRIRPPLIEMKEGTFSDERKPKQDNKVLNHAIADDSINNDNHTIQNGNSATPNGNGAAQAPTVETPDNDEQCAEDVKETSL